MITPIIAFSLAIAIDVLLIYFNYKFAKKENKDGGSKFFFHLFTAFLAFWVIALGFDIFSLISFILGG